MKKRLLAALMAGAMALTMTACGGSSSGSDDSNAASGSDSGSAGSYKVGIVQLVQHEALDAATQGFQDKLKELVEADGGEVKFDSQNASGESANCTTIVNGFVSAGVDLIMANATAALQRAGDRAGVQRSDRCGYDHLGRAVERYYRRVQQSVLPVSGGKQYLECAE